MLNDSSLLGSKPDVGPLDPFVKLYQDNGKPFDDITSYIRLMGRLLYLNTTRLDITFSSQQLRQFLHAPIMTHFNASTLVRYLKHNLGRGLLMNCKY